MKYKLIAAGSGILFIVVGCIAVVLITGIAGWFIFQPTAPSTQAARRIVTVAPHTSAQTISTPESPSLEITPEAPQPLSTPESAQVEVEPSPQTDVESQNSTAETYTLPPNSVNSVTQEGVATRLVIPKLEVDAPIMLAPIENQTWNVSHLEQAVGHLEGTASPGSSSNIVLAGHVTLAAGVYGPFAGLAQLETGDELIVYQGDQLFRYVVDGYQVVERTNVEVTYPSQTGQITLITCNNWNRESNRYEQRIVVKGHLLNQ
jgi:LPXTG-site transpeptidase (sortase) family protein